MTDPDCQINKIRLQKVASNEHLGFRVAYTLTNPVTFQPSGRTKLVTETPKKAQKWCAELGDWASMSFQSVSVENGKSLGPKKSCDFRKMTDPDCQINKIRLQKVASNEHLVLRVKYTLTNPVTFRPSGRTKLVTGTPKKAQKWCAGIWEAWASMSFQSVRVENDKSLGPLNKLRFSENDGSRLPNQYNAAAKSSEQGVLKRV